MSVVNDLSCESCQADKWDNGLPYMIIVMMLGSIICCHFSLTWDYTVLTHALLYNVCILPNICFLITVIIPSFPDQNLIILVSAAGGGCLVLVVIVGVVVWFCHRKQSQAGKKFNCCVSFNVFLNSWLMCHHLTFAFFLQILTQMTSQFTLISLRLQQRM